MARRIEYIHQRPTWPAFTWDGAALAPQLARVRHAQGLLIGRMSALGSDSRAEAQVAVTTSEVVSSSAIEGERLGADEVRSSVARRLGLDASGLPAASREVEGFVELMFDATTKFDQPLTAARLFAWHAALFPTGRSGLGRIAVGAWRTKASDPMRVLSGAIGRERVHFVAPSGELVAREMNAFLNWFNAPPSDDPVLRAAVAHLWFVTVHPFEDGNGRIARAIAEMALSRADGMSSRFYSMSSRIERTRKHYYEQLESAQRGDLDITAWMAWFLGCLEAAIADAEEQLQGALRNAAIWRRALQQPTNDRQRRVVERMLGRFEGVLSTSKYAKLAKCSTDTALRDIQDLVARGVLIQNPTRGRSTSYRLAEPPADE